MGTYKSIAITIKGQRWNVWEVIVVKKRGSLGLSSGKKKWCLGWKFILLCWRWFW
jgi:hypothetical protein